MVKAKARSNCTYNTAGKTKQRTIQFYIHPEPHPPAFPVQEVLWSDYEGHFWGRCWIEKKPTALGALGVSLPSDS